MFRLAGFVGLLALIITSIDYFGALGVLSLATRLALGMKIILMFWLGVDGRLPSCLCNICLPSVCMLAHMFFGTLFFFSCLQKPMWPYLCGFSFSRARCVSRLLWCPRLLSLATSLALGMTIILMFVHEGLYLICNTLSFLFNLLEISIARRPITRSARAVHLGVLGDLRLR